MVSRYLSANLIGYVSSSESHLKGLIAMFCGPMFQIEESRKDLETLMGR